jgi:hypothetical protein
LTDPLILQTQRQSTEWVHGGFNFDNGPAANILDKIAANRDQQAAKECRLAQNREALDNKPIYQRAGKLTSGAMVGAGEYHLGNDLLEHAQKHDAVRTADVASRLIGRSREPSSFVKMLPQLDWWNRATGMVLIFERCVPTRRVRTTEGKADLEDFYETIKDNTSPDKPPMPALNSASLPVQLIESSNEDDDNDIVLNAVWTIYSTKIG